MKKLVYIASIALLLSVGAEAFPKKTDSAPAVTEQTSQQENSNVAADPASIDNVADSEKTDGNPADAIQASTENVVPKQSPAQGKPADVKDGADGIDVTALLSVIALLLSLAAAAYAVISKIKLGDKLHELRKKLSYESLDMRYVGRSEIYKKCAEAYDEKMSRSMSDIDDLVERKIAFRFDTLAQPMQNVKPSAAETTSDAAPVAEEPAPFPSKTFYADYDSGYRGFPVDYLESEPNGKVYIIKTTSETTAEYTLIDNVSPTLIQSALPGCEFDGDSQHYNNISNVSAGLLHYDEQINAWVVDKKLKIQFS